MDRQKQIEEMAKDINNTWFVKPNGDICGTNEKLKKNDIQMISHQLICDGYRKIPENAVVLTEEELFARDEKLHKADNEYIKALEECINNRNEKTRKETAEKLLDEIDYESNGQTKSITDLLRKKYGV